MGVCMSACAHVYKNVCVHVSVYEYVHIYMCACESMCSM